MAITRLFVALYLDADVSKKLARVLQSCLLRLLNAVTAEEMKNGFRNLGEFK